MQCPGKLSTDLWTCGFQRQREMDTKDIVVFFFVLLLCYSLKCVGNELSKVARELADGYTE